jgi:hypothetical protein
MRKNAKEAMIQAVRDGEPMVKERRPEHELESQELQDQILNPAFHEIEVDGKTFKLPTEFTLADIFRKRVLDNVKFFLNLYMSELQRFRGTVSLDANDPLQVGILQKPSIMMALEELLATVTKKPLVNFEGKLDEVAAMNTVIWLMKVTERYLKLKNGEPEPGK